MSAARSLQTVTNGSLGDDGDLEDDLCFSSDEEGIASEKVSQQPQPKEEATKPSSKQNSQQSFHLRLQKNLIGRIQTRQSIKPLIGRHASESLKCFEDLAKQHITDQSERKTLLRHIIKTLGKVGVIARSGNHGDETLKHAQVLRERVRALATTVISYTRAQRTYSRNYLTCQITDCQNTLKQCVGGLVSNDSIDRINYIFDVLKREHLLDSVFSPSATAAQREALVKFVVSLESALKTSTMSATPTTSK